MTKLDHKIIGLNMLGCTCFLLAIAISNNGVWGVVGTIFFVLIAILLLLLAHSLADDICANK